jgi:hypothetical protein
MRRNVIQAACAAALLFSLCPHATADDAAISGTGGNVKMMRGGVNVRMVREDVRVTGIPNGKVIARFEFRNEGPAADILMGFPGEGGADGSPDLSRFISTVDGKPVKTVFVRNKSSESAHNVWYTKKVHFGAGQTHIVTDTYDVGNAGIIEGPQWFFYVLETGSTWKGPIGRAVITCDISGISAYTPAKISPAGYKMTGNVITWDLHDLNPTAHDDIQITWYESFDNVVVNGKPVYFHRKGSLERLWPDSGDDEIFYDKPKPLRRGNDVWLTTAQAAKWLGAKRQVVRPGKVERLTVGSRWADVTVGSKVLQNASGRTTMKFASTSEGDEPEEALTVALSPLVRALAPRPRSRRVCLVRPRAQNAVRETAPIIRRGGRPCPTTTPRDIPFGAQRLSGRIHLARHRALLIPRVAIRVLARPQWQQQDARVAADFALLLAADDEAGVLPDHVGELERVVRPVLIHDPTARCAGDVRARPVQRQAVVDANPACARRDRDNALGMLLPVPRLLALVGEIAVLAMIEKPQLMAAAHHAHAAILWGGVVQHDHHRDEIGIRMRKEGEILMPPEAALAGLLRLSGELRVLQLDIVADQWLQPADEA